MEEDVLLRITGLSKTFEQGGRSLAIFKNLELKIEAGEIAALVGPSGAGKSTLMQIAGLLDRPDAGSIRIGGQEAQGLSDGARTRLRRDAIGFVYQFHHLLPEFTALENVAMPQIIRGVSRRHAHAKAGDLLASMGLAERLDHRPARLSGGEQQRVAIARALVNDPRLLLADEPTGNLDPGTSAGVFEILMRHVRERNIGALIATHNIQLADRMDRVLELRAGKLEPF
ncbi:MAG: ABC transporter ATP-binding protein [Alphaproteobacteria bacterium]|nr:ABC transporter ATP-binding protein [Alphaproteobacteria bacterium]